MQSISSYAWITLCEPFESCSKSQEKGKNIKVTLIIDVYETSDILRLIQNGS